MRNPIQAEMQAKVHMKNRLAEAEHYRLVRLVQSTSEPERRRLPEMSALRKLVLSMGHTAVLFPPNPK